MTLRRLRETRSLSGMPLGAEWTDPAAIPPPGLNNMSRAGVTVTAHTALQVDTVFTALRVIRNAIIKMGDPRAYQPRCDEQGRRWKQYLTTQPSVLTNTWADTLQYDGQTRTVISMALFGEAFWLTLARDRLLRPNALEVLHPAFMEVKRDSSGQRTYTYGSGANKQVLDPDDVTHIPFMALPGAARGLNPIEYGGVSFALAMAAMTWAQNWFANGASPGYLLTSETKIGQEEIERIASKFLIDHSGLSNAHLPLVVDGGMKVERTGATAVDADAINVLNYSRVAVGAWFGLPSHLVGGSNDREVWGKTVQEMGYQLVDFTLSGYTVPLNQAYSSLLPKGTLADHDESAILRANAADLAAEIQALRTAASISPNDVRTDYLNKPPVPGGDAIDAPLASNVAPGGASQVIKDADKEDDAGESEGFSN